MVQLTGKRKIAALLLSLDRNSAAKILKNFSEEDILSIGEAMKEISGLDIPCEDLAEVYRSFTETMQARSGIFRARDEQMEELFNSTLGSDRSRALLEELQRRYIPSQRRYVPASPFSDLSRFPTEILVKILNDEHPQTVALVLSQIESNRAAKVIEELGEELGLDVITRIAKLKNPPVEMMLQIADALKDKGRKALREESPEEAKERLQTVADVLNRVDKQTEQSVLGRIGESDADMAEEIRELMFTFEDLLLVDKRAMQKILSGINVQVLAMALKGANKQMEAFIRGNVSKRVGNLIEEEKEMMGPKPLQEVMEAQREIVSTVRALIESGEITINRVGEEDLVA